MEANLGLTNTHGCLNCKQPAKPTDLYCIHCGYILPHALDQAPRTIALSGIDKQSADLQWGTGYFDYRAKLWLHLEAPQNSNALDIVEVPLHCKSAILGRGSAENANEVRVDLTTFGALEQGVSRRHARIDLHGDVLHVTDLDSANGTFLNRSRLAPDVVYILRNRAVIQLGHMILRAQFA